MDPEEEVADAHAMLDRLDAPGGRGQSSIRERLCYLLRGYTDWRPLPTDDEVLAVFSPTSRRKP